MAQPTFILTWARSGFNFFFSFVSFRYVKGCFWDGFYIYRDILPLIFLHTDDKPKSTKKSEWPLKKAYLWETSLHGPTAAPSDQRGREQKGAESTSPHEKVGMIRNNYKFPFFFKQKKPPSSSFSSLNQRTTTFLIASTNSNFSKTPHLIICFFKEKKNKKTKTTWRRMALSTTCLLLVRPA